MTTFFQRTQSQWSAELEWWELLLHREARRRRNQEQEMDGAVEYAAITMQLELARTRALARRTAEFPLVRLARTFRLTPEEQDLLALALLPELSAHYDPLLTLLGGLGSELALRLLGDTEELRKALGPAGTLFHEGLLLRIDPVPERPVLRASGLALSPLCASALLGLEVPAPAHTQMRVLTKSDEARETEPALLECLVGLRGSGRLAWAETRAKERGCLRLWILDLAGARAAGQAWPVLETSLMLRWRLERGVGVYVRGGDALFDTEGALHSGAASFVASLSAGSGPSFVELSLEVLAHSLRSNATAHVVDFPLPTTDDRVHLWATALKQVGRAVASKQLLALAEACALTSGEINELVVEAFPTRGGRVSESQVATLRQAAQERAGRHLERLAVRATTHLTGKDLILQPGTARKLQQIASALRHERKTLQEWGFGSGLTAGKSLKALFTGPPGTGKSLAVGVLAGESGRLLYRVDLPRIVSKYIGETEKNLDRLFEAAHGSGAILCFDEADALFGKRSEVKDAHDRYANMEASYLLQKLEAHDGIVFLTSNLGSNIDPAFSRRIEWLVEFPLPDTAQRFLLWQRLLPPRAPRATDIDFHFLAERFAFAGGDIRNAVLSAGFLAAAEDVPIEMRHLLAGVVSQLQRQGRLPAASDFGGYATLLDIV